MQRVFVRGAAPSFTLVKFLLNLLDFVVSVNRVALRHLFPDLLTELDAVDLKFLLLGGLPPELHLLHRLLSQLRVVVVLSGDLI